jgi:signal transduction histidine kinase
MGGKIKLLSSEPDKGATFSIRFPVVESGESISLHAGE